MLSWNSMEVGTRKIPPAIPPPTQNLDDIFAPPPPIPTEEKYNQQIREEKLSSLLASGINHDDGTWLKYDEWPTQIKLDLADMILEEMIVELI